MQEALRLRCEKFIENRDLLKENFKMSSIYLHALSANYFLSTKQAVDISKMKEAREILRKNVGLFSNYKGIAELLIISILAVSENPEEKLAMAIKYNEKLREKFRASQYLTLASIILTDLVDENEIDELINRGRDIFDGMKKNHRWLTGQEDTVMALLLAFSERENTALFDDMEEVYDLITPVFRKNNYSQMLSHILTLNEGSNTAKVTKVLDVFNGLEGEGRKYGKTFELAVLATVVNIEESAETIVRDTLAVDELLSKYDGYGPFAITKRGRLMHALMLVVDHYLDLTNPLENTTTLGSLIGTIYMIIAQSAAVAASTATISN